MNEQFIKIFNDLAVYEDYLKRPFPAKAYRNAVKIFKEIDFQVTDAKQIKDIKGIGDGILKKVEEFLKNGHFKKYDEYLASPVKAMKEISQIKGIGINKAKILFEAGIDSLDKLKKAVANLKVGDYIAGNVRLTKAVKTGLDFEAHTDKTRMTVEEHDAVADPLLKKIRENADVICADAVGSRRRWNGIDKDYTIGDIDIIISSEKDIHEFLESLLDEVVMSGKTKVSGIKDRRQIDFRVVENANYGALLMHATGPMQWNIALRKIAMKKNQILNEYGLFEIKTNKCIAAKTESDILTSLGLNWVEPSQRLKMSEEI